MGESKVSMKLLINSQTNKVLFAEAGKECVDFLFHILSLPLATVIRLLQKQGMVGCLGNLYESVENLNETYIQPHQNKDALLKPFGTPSVPMLLLKGGAGEESTGKVAYRCSYCSGLYYSDVSRALCRNCNNQMTYRMTYVAPPADVSKDALLKPIGTPSVPQFLFQGGAWEESIGKVAYKCSYCSGLYYSDVSRALCPSCNRKMKHRMTYVAPPVDVSKATAEGGFVKGVVTYMVMDNLVVKPMSTISSLTLLNKFDVKDITALKEKEVHLGMKEAVKLLKTCLHSKQVLTAVFLNNN